MSEKTNTGDAFVLILMAVLIAAWGVAGSLDVSKRTQPGFSTNENHEIVTLKPNGSAEQINMQVGDRIIGIDGNRIEDTSTIVRLPRVPEGERRSFTVTRGEQTIRYRPVFTSLNDREMAREQLSIIVGFAFLLIPLVACITRPAPATRVLALMGLGLSLHFFDGPYLVSYDVHAVALTVVQLFVLLGLAAMIHFLHLFPLKRSLIQKPWGKKLIYFPVLLIWFADAWRILFTPPASSVPAQLAKGFSETGMIAYFMLGLILVVANYISAQGAERSRLALNQMLLASLVASVPIVTALLAGSFLPELILPWQNYYFVLLALVPMAWSYSASRIPRR
ncbi:MAG TPA: PDZ domain-containing protein [Xanthomonadales bacterium]|nr:PDZ domain-containing protein [Xanthomonadales bacterium]